MKSAEKNLCGSDCYRYQITARSVHKNKTAVSRFRIRLLRLWSCLGCGQCQMRGLGINRILPQQVVFCHKFISADYDANWRIADC